MGVNKATEKHDNLVLVKWLMEGFENIKILRTVKKMTKMD